MHTYVCMCVCQGVGDSATSEVSLQMKIIVTCVISVAERWLLSINNHLSVITIKSYVAIRTMKFSLSISQAI